MGESEYEFRADTAKNRLYIRLSGFFRETDTAEMYKELESALDKLKYGFDVILDMPGLKAGSPAAVAWLEKGAGIIKARGRRRGVHISNSFVTALMQFKRVLEGVFTDKTTRTAKSVEEAERILDEWDSKVEVGA
jgi:hypothetical protein